jgi:hypothetical protein
MKYIGGLTAHIQNIVFMFAPNLDEDCSSDIH